VLLLTDPRPRIGFIGAGRVATALAVRLSDTGYPVGAAASRSAASAHRLARRIAGCEAVTIGQAVVDTVDLVFITTPDDAIESVVGALRWRPESAVVHTSGAAALAPLAAAREQGAAVGSLHPLQTFADRDSPPSLEGIVFAVEASGALREQLLGIVADLGGTPVELRPEERALYHASAVLVSNYSVTLIKLATDLWLRFGWERPAALRALLPLLAGTLRNLETQGLPAALTGPVARGDAPTVAQHLAALDAAAPGLAAVYRALATETIPVALARGGLSEDNAASIREVLAAEREAATR
jgi:predicted short-subunit dehydrogenase-like oxidoreductase (DUF2520 family)